ncbi:hypothetical protein [Fluviibacter phosphoraccumulans]|uniref:hypothetical protein n=1 Tax=Fluviibacter phosphoraccumulans TaxID=1751046 RepID=UPI0010B190CB|nr:hypothetical protein [Fluviibacter phosphoraccumulans]BCA64652.1 hypothetical protein SHINM1_002540 [Fluviibacter phosphoraccumulans]
MTKDLPGSVTVRLGALREPLAIYCAASGLSTSDAIRELVSTNLLELPASTMPINIDDEAEPRVRLELRLTPTERAAIEARCARDGFTSANRWVVSLIRANLMKEPEFGETGLDALHESNRLLAPLARNLNQLTRDVRQIGIQVPAYRFQILENLQSAIAAHTKVIATVISRNVGRWRSE